MNINKEFIYGNKSWGLSLKNTSIVFLGFFLIMSFFTLSDVKNMKYLGIGCIVLLGVMGAFVFFNFLIIRKAILKKLVLVETAFLVMIFIFFIGLINGDINLYGISKFLQFLLVFAFFNFALIVRWDDQKIKVLAYYSGIFIIINFVYWFISGTPYPFKSFTLNYNCLGSISLILIFFIFAVYKRNNSLWLKSLFFFLLVFDILLCLSSQSRASLLAIIVFLVSYKLWNILICNKKLYYLCFFLIIVFNFLFIYLYSWDQNFLISIYNDYIFQFTGKPLFTGRELLWKQIMDKIMEYPFFGYGLGLSMTKLIGVNISEHNLFFATTIRLGLMGLFVLLFLFFVFWNFFWIGRFNYYVKLTACFFIAFIVYQNFEISLFSDNMAVAMWFWLIMGIGFSNVIDEIEKEV